MDVPHRPIEVLSVADFLSLTFERVPDIVDDLIPGGGVIGLAGAPKTGKTMIGLALSAAAATGADFLGRATRRTRTLFIGEEGAPNSLQTRVRTIGATLPMGDHPDAFQGVAVRQGVRLDTPEDLARLDDAVAAARPGLVILDCLVRMHRLAENDSRDMVGLMENLEAFASRHACAVLFIHHVAKASEDSTGGYSMRGSGVLASSTEANLLLRRTRSGARLDGQLRDGPEIRLDLEFDAQALQFRPVVAGAQATRGRPSERLLLIHLETNPGSTVDQMAAALSTSDTTLRPMVASLVRSGRVSAMPAARGRGWVYRLAA